MLVYKFTVLVLLIAGNYYDFSLLHNTGSSHFIPGYVAEKCCTNQNRANQTQNAHSKLCISWGLEG
jgi:hypothetical protein